MLGHYVGSVAPLDSAGFVSKVESRARLSESEKCESDVQKKCDRQTERVREWGAEGGTGMQ